MTDSGAPGPISQNPLTPPPNPAPDAPDATFQRPPDQGYQAIGFTAPDYFQGDDADYQSPPDFASGVSPSYPPPSYQSPPAVASPGYGVASGASPNYQPTPAGASPNFQPPPVFGSGASPNYQPTSVLGPAAYPPPLQYADPLQTPGYAWQDGPAARVPQGYGVYDAYQPPQPKRITGVIVAVVIVVVVAIIGILAAWGLTRGGGPTPSPSATSQPVPSESPTDSSQTSSDSPLSPTDTSTSDITATSGNNNTSSPFCLSYTVFSMSMLSWVSYEVAVRTGDYAQADTYITTLLTNAQNLKSAGPPDNLTSTIDSMIDYLTRLHAALQAGGVAGISDDDTSAFMTSYGTLSAGAVKYCFS